MERRPWGAVIALVAGLAAGAYSGPTAADLKMDTRCGRPDIAAEVVFPTEPVAYDLEDHPEFAAKGRPLGLFSARHRIAYQARIAGGCLKKLAVTVTVEPRIHLRSIYKKKIKKCARSAVLDHEKGHARVARTEYASLARDIEKLAERVFANKRVPDAGAAKAAFSGALAGRFLGDFQARYDAAQDAFHAKLTSAELIRKNCRLSERKW